MGSRMDYNLLIGHLFLPRALPVANNDQELVDAERKLLAIFSTFLSTQKTEQLFGEAGAVPDSASASESESGDLRSSFQHVQNLFATWRTWTKIQQDQDSADGVQEFQESISRLEVGASLAYFVRAQNATIIITNISNSTDHRLRLSAFLASQSNETIYESDGDLVAELPGLCIDIPLSNVIQSDIFAEDLIRLCCTPYQPTLKTISKGGNELGNVNDIRHPMLVTQYLTTILSDQQSSSVDPADFHRVTKKIRDQVVMEKTKGEQKLFRRSGLWFSIKVTLQLELINRFGRDTGLMLYKMLLLDFLTNCCMDWITTTDEVSADLEYQMLAKISRRLAKIVVQFPDSPKKQQPSISKLHIQIFSNKIDDAILRLKRKMDADWTAEICEYSKSRAIRPIRVDRELVEKSTVHELNNSWSYFNQLSSSTELTSVVPPPPGRERFRLTDTTNYPARFLSSTKDEELLGLILLDFEQYIFSLPRNYLTTAECKFFRELLESYIAAANPYYDRDPVGASRMVLTCLKILELLDTLAVEKYPLLKDHDSGVAEGIMSVLLATTKEDLERLNEIEDYFRARNKNSTLPSLIEDGKPTSDYFSVRFGAQNWEMMALRAKILEETEQKCRAKRAELDQERKKCDKLREEERKMEHEIDVPSRKYPGTLNHNWRCKKCAKDREIEDCMVSLYEKSLPGNSDCQNAIIFELLIPIEIACLRDALHLFLASVCSATIQDSNCSNGIQQKWTQWDQLIGHYKNPHQTHITLGSTVQSALGVFVASGQSKLHVDKPDEEFILENGLNCLMCTIAITSSDSSRVLKYTSPHQVLENVKKRCTFEVELRSGCTFEVELRSAYAGMQWMLNSTNHSQNEVLASQFSCPQNLQLAEYKEFGSLRAGHLLQLRNLFRSLALESLSFREESVLSLVCQTIWEAGPPMMSGANVFHRESHEDLVMDPHFTAEFISVLCNFLEKNRKNWNDQHILLTVILLCNRILSVRAGEGGDNCQLRAAAIGLALECRKVATEWIEAIEKLLLTMTTTNSSPSQSQGEPSSDLDQDPDPVHAEQTKLRLKLVQISACGALTFTAIPIATETATLSQWLVFIAKIDDNILLTNSNPKNLPTMTRNVLRLVRNVGVGLEHHFHDLSAGDVSQVLGEFVESQWSGAPSDMQNTVLWKRGECQSDQWYTAECAGNGNGNNVLQMDIILGKFLVDGNPISRLPFAITNHSDFKRIFGNFIFVVQADTKPCTFVTKDRFADGCKYKFFQMATELVITEVMEGEDYQLVPHAKFKGDIPKLLIHDFSHWWHKSKKVVEFRGKDFLAPGFRTDVKYQLDLQTRQLVDTTHHKSMLDINKLLYRDMARVMSRLELRKYVHVFQDSNEETGALLSISLPRIDLHFHVINDGRIMSEEHRGFRVRESSQEFGTLIGLEHGLVLECKHYNNIVLMPHGKLSAFPPEGDRQHHSVSINMKTPRNPPVFIFEVDETLHRLKAQPVQGAWVYLAYLHALTSGVLPDPLTGLTGTESAMTLLQSPFCWSGEPMDEETRRTLSDIQDLSPVRRYYPDHLREIELVKFPTGIPSVCAHDAYIFLGHKLIADSARMAFAYPRSNQKKVHELDEKKVKLVRRAYWRSTAIYSSQAQVRPDFDPEFTNQLSKSMCRPTSSLDPDFWEEIPPTSFNGENLVSVRMLADLGHSWTAPQSLDANVLVTTICDCSAISNPLSHKALLGGFYDWIQINVVQDWLSLYNYARIVEQEGLQPSWTLMLGAMAYCRNTADITDCDAEDIVKHLEILQAIAVHHKEFLNLNPPPFEGCYSDTDQDKFNRQVLEKELRKAAVEFGGCREPKGLEESVEDYNARCGRECDEHATQVKLQITKVLNDLEEKFKELDEGVDACRIQTITNLTHLTNLEGTNDVIKAELFKWRKNKKLKEFVLSVQSKLDKIYGSGNGNGIGTCTWPDFQSTVNMEALTDFGRRTKFCVDQYDGVARLRKETGEPGRGEITALDGMVIHQNWTEQPPFPNGSSNHNTELGPPYPLETYESGGLPEPIAKKYNDDLRESWNLYVEQQQQGEGTLGAGARQLVTEAELKIRKAEATKLWDGIQAWIQRHDQIPALRTAGLLNRITPTTILPLLLCNGNTLEQRLGEQIEQVAIAWTNEQKARRCLRLAAAGPSMELALQRELETTGNEKRLPPEWLLLQLEMDIMIRRVQMDVAEKMMAGQSSADHALMQLNMGEGKTSVIIPMLASILANGSQLCRVTVLKSLYTTNKKMLAFSIGGLLGQTVYTFPCRRDMSFDSENVTTIQHLYEECLQKRGVVVTAPEYRLSFQLKLYEKCESDARDSRVAQKLGRIHNWLRDNARDILDECDEILNVKYQLVYTIGDQQQVTGGQERWAVCQKLLKILPKHLDELLLLLLQEGGSHPKIELQYSREDKRDGEWKLFPVCRILDADNVYRELCETIAEDIVEGKTDIMPELHNQDEKRLLRKLLTEPALSKADHDEATDTFINLKSASVASAPYVTTILVLRGLLAYGVLLHCLTRRWRVNYGVNPKDRKQMAVPFRAKDIASERTEFGHMDVAILLTQLSYYYSGLTEAQVRECLHELDRCEDKHAKYESWVEKIPDLDPSISTFAGINLADYDQTITVTIPTLQRNMLVIDFWLSKVVYPRECKQFRHKLTCTPWDLCSTEMKQPVTGFSGTNDTSLLLPLTIKQEDLPELKGTNGQVLHNLLKPENNNYDVFQLGITGRQILTKLVSKGIPLLIDIGALMIDLSNEQVACTWLSLEGEHGSGLEYKAAVYFNDMDEIMVLDQRGRKTPLSLSPYRTNLDACLIYLDDVHTRGTDLKIPRDTTGCVTLGKGVTKDKLVQGCMRLRMLGNGHRVAFFASQEVDAEIRNVSRMGEVGTKEVLLWSIKNSSTVTRDGFQHWTTAAANFYTKAGAHMLYELSNHSNKDLKYLGDLCQEAEILDLKSLYGSFRFEEKFQVFVKGRMTALAKAFERKLLETAPAAIITQFEEGQAKVVGRCRTYASNVKKFSTLLDEEQERELEQELEQEREQRRPGNASAAEPGLAPELELFIQSTRPSVQSQSWLLPLPRALPQLFNADGVQINAQKDSWGRNMYATKDFYTVIERVGSGSKVKVDGGEYIRPVTWFITKETQQGDVLVLLSPFEANCVKNMFKQNLVRPATYLHMFAPRLRQDHSTFWTTPQLTQPPSSSGSGGSDHVKDGAWQNQRIFNSNLLIFSGSLFFKDEEEQNYYCHVLGLIPKSIGSFRDIGEEQAVAKNYTKNRWLLPEYRGRSEISSHGAALWCEFYKNPVQLVQGIIECRGHILSESTHAYKILHRSQKVEFMDMGGQGQQLGHEWNPMEED